MSTGNREDLLALPLVSIIVPCYNRGRFVREAIDSALSQTYRNIEVIAVDDGSTDDTLEILKSYGERIRLIEQKNGGSSAARNTAITASRGSFLAWLDSDDAFLPEKIERQISAAQRWPEAGLIHTRCYSIDAESKILPVAEQERFEDEDKLEGDALERLLVHCYPNTSSCLVRADVVRSVGVFDATWRFAEDWEFCLRIAGAGYPFAYVGERLTLYREHRESKTANRFPHALGQIRLRRFIEDNVSQWGEMRGNSEKFRESVARHRREFAKAYWRLGKLHAGRGEWQLASANFKNSVQQQPARLKYRMSLAGSNIRSLFSGRSDSSEKATTAL